jgi:hypothetical protein
VVRLVSEESGGGGMSGGRGEGIGDPAAAHKYRVTERGGSGEILRGVRRRIDKLK